MTQCEKKTECCRENAEFKVTMKEVSQIHNLLLCPIHAELYKNDDEFEVTKLIVECK